MRRTRKSGGQPHFKYVVVRWTTRLSALITNPAVYGACGSRPIHTSVYGACGSRPTIASHHTSVYAACGNRPIHTSDSVNGASGSRPTIAPVHI